MEARTNRAPMSTEVLESRWEADEAACWAHRRLHVYRLLSAGFGPPTGYLRRLISTGEFLGYLRQALSLDPEEFAEPLEALALFFRAEDPAGRAEAEYRRLFSHGISLRGSDHGGSGPERVRAFYREAGMDLFRSPLPADHLSVETAFLAALAEREMEAARRGLGAEGSRRLARRFLGEHVAPWAPRFAEGAGAAESKFYAPMARILAGWVALETTLDIPNI